MSPCLAFASRKPADPGRTRKGRRRRARFFALAGLVLFLASSTAYPWGSFRGVLGIKVTDTHQQIVQAAFDLFLWDPLIKGLSGIPVGGGRTVWIDRVLEYEGVNGSISSLAPYGPGPDAEGSTLYSCHWFNPRTGRGLAPQSAADWYSKFIQGIMGIAGGEEEIFKGLAWSSHFLADMFVPYHLAGVPADEALARVAAGNFIMGDAEAGPEYLWQPAPPPPIGSIPGTPFGDAALAYEAWKRDGWGYKGNFRELYDLFRLNHQAAGRGRPLNHLDWFDPWYWTGLPAKTIVVGLFFSDPSTDPGRSVLSTHATYESMAHGRFLESGGYKQLFGAPPPYDRLWQNAPPDYSFSGTAWQAQSWQVQDFAAKVAERTRQNTDAYWKAPDSAVRGAVEAVYTMWRSAYTALQPQISVGRDPARPNDGLVISANVQNRALEECRGVSLRLKIEKNGGVVVENVQPPSGGIAGMGARAWSWFATVNPNEEWTVVVEAVGSYAHTPDLQYALAFTPYRPDPAEVRQARPVEEADAGDFVGSFVHTDPNRSYEQYHGEMALRADGTFTDVETFTNGSEVRRGSGIWRFDPATMTVSVDWQPGGEFSGPVSGNTADFTINGRWSNGGSGTLRFVRR